MTQNEYKPVSWNGEPITNAKLNQMADNTQFLFERTPRIRYSNSGIVRDSGLKMIVGKTPIPVTQASALEFEVYFGDFFSAGCRPSVTGTVECIGVWHHRNLTIRPLGSYTTYGESDYRGVKFHLWDDQVQNFNEGGFVHWQAVGY